MTQKERKLLLVDLCARLPHGVICQIEDDLIINDSQFFDYKLTCRHLDLLQNNLHFYIKPYLRPLSSMTDNEDKLLHFLTSIEGVDWLNAKHFDYRGLISKGLALEAPKDMYN